MKTYEKFLKIILDELSSILLEDIDLNKQEFGKVVKNFLFETDGPTSMNSKFSIKQLHVFKLFRNLNEISDSKDKLEDIIHYMAVYPYRNKNLSRSRNLVYHIENYLNEVYILKQRLIKYSKIIAKAYRNNIPQKPKEFSESINLDVVNSLDPLIKIRGKHVHVERYEHDDLRRLHVLNSFANYQGEGNLLKYFDEYFNYKFRETRTKWKKYFSTNNESIMKMLDRYFEKLIPVISSNGKFKYPIKKSS